MGIFHEDFCLNVLSGFPKGIIVLASRRRKTRETLRTRALPLEREAQLWDELTTQAVYYTDRLEGNPLTFEEARAVIEAHKKATTD